MNQQVDFNIASEVLKTEMEVPSAGRKIVKIHDTNNHFTEEKSATD